MGIKMKRSAVASKVPATTDLELGELGVNTYDGKLFLKKSVGGTESIVEVGPVASVAGKTGAVTLAKADVSLGNVDNTSDAAKPISMATQTALNGKAAASHGHAVGDITGLGTAATLNVGTGPNNIVQLDGSSKLPAVDGSQLINLPASSGAPSGAVMAYAGITEPTGWLFARGQAVSRATYADLFAAIGTTYGAGDGSTTFALPDLRGHVVAGRDNMGGTSANRLTNQSGGVDGDVLGATGGAERHTLTQTEMPAHTHQYGTSGSGGGGTSGGGASSTRATSSTGGGGAHNNVQPTIILNYIIKI